MRQATRPPSNGSALQPAWHISPSPPPPPSPCQIARAKETMDKSDSEDRNDISVSPSSDTVEKVVGIEAHNRKALSIPDSDAGLSDKEKAALVGALRGLLQITRC